MYAVDRFLKSLALALCLAPLALAQGTAATQPAKEYVHLNGRVIATRTCPGCPTVVLADTTHPGTTNYRVGDSFTVTVKGPPNQPVTVSQNGGSLYTFGNTDVNGNWSIPGSWGSGNAGTYSQVWAVGGISAVPLLIFTVSP